MFDNPYNFIVEYFFETSDNITYLLNNRTVERFLYILLKKINMILQKNIKYSEDNI